MRYVHAASVLSAALALGLVPGRSAAQLASADQRFWAAPRGAAPRPSVWRLSADATPVAAIKPGTSLTFGQAVPTPRLAWRGSDLALAGVFTAGLLIDAAQTRGLARAGWTNFRESNPLLGAQPSVGRVNTYTAIAGLTVLGTAAALPRRWRPWLLGAAIAVQALTISSSVRQGIPVRFP
ncbi:MAG TPA: hypothetical protein VFD76_01065 [Gemmatimonadales bacterium]|nr:hypothetical protein [Gemmatimonadales bacterium]